MADEVIERTQDEWADLLGKMFPALVQVVFTGDNSSDYIAKPFKVKRDVDTDMLVWVLSISESHPVYVPLSKVTVNDNGTLSLNVQGRPAIARPRAGAQA